MGRAGVSGGHLGPAELRRLGTLYRASAADLAVARRSFPDTGGTLRLQALVASAYGLVYSRAERTETPTEFLTSGLWRRIRQNIACVGLAAAVMFGFAAFERAWLLVAGSAVAFLFALERLVRRLRADRGSPQSP